MADSTLLSFDRIVSSRHRAWLGAAVIVVLTIVSYGPAMNGGFIWDDDDYVTRNRLLHDAAGLMLLWEPGNTRQYYPLVFTTFWIEYHLWQLDPLGYHVVNVLLHLANALLIWRIMLRIGIPGAWMIGAVFALHPVHIESVAWVTERKNVLSGLFYLLAALCYFRFDPPREESAGADAPGRAWVFYGGSMLLFVLALLSKSVTCSLPAALILVMLLGRRPVTPRRLLPLVPMFVIGVLAALHTASLERTNVGAVGDPFDFTFIERGLIASQALLFYPSKLLVPYPLIFTYPRWTIDAGDWLSYWSIALVLLLAAVCVIAYARGRRGPTLAIAFYAGTIFPALGFVNVYPMRLSFVADHFVYLASIGVIALVVGTLAPYAKHRSVRPYAMVLVAIVLAFLGALSFVRGRDYAGAETIYRRTVEANPHAWLASNNLGNILLRDHARIDDALRRVRRAEPVQAVSILEQSERLALRAAAAVLRERDEAAARSTLTGLQELSGDLIDEAIEHYESSLDAYSRQFPGDDHYQARGNLATALDRQGRFDEAIAHWHGVLENRRAAPHDHARMAGTLERAGRLDEAIGQYSAAVASTETLGTVDLASHKQLARLLVERGDDEGARRHLEIVVEHDPDDIETYWQLGVLAENAGRYDQATRHYVTALDRSPTEAQRIRLMLRLAIIFTSCPDVQFRRPQEGLRYASSLNTRTGGRDPFVLSLLAAARAGLGEFDLAIELGEQALTLAERSPAVEQPAVQKLIADLRARLAAYRAGRIDPVPPPGQESPGG